MRNYQRNVQEYNKVDAKSFLFGVSNSYNNSTYDPSYNLALTIMVSFTNNTVFTVKVLGMHKIASKSKKKKIREK